MKIQRGFTLIESLVVISIIGVIMSLVLVNLNVARQKTRDLKRKTDLSQIGRYLTLSCYVPNAGAGEYDLMELADELKTRYPQYAGLFSQIPRDPKSGTDTESFYFYIVNTSGNTKCALYANFENDKEQTTLDITEPIPGGGSGIFRSSVGWNGSSKYFQISN